jgi:predicted amidophosphoribosyltransferase
VNVIVCPYCVQPIAEDATSCPSCLHEIADALLEVDEAELRDMETKVCVVCSAEIKELATCCPVCASWQSEEDDEG